MHCLVTSRCKHFIFGDKGEATCWSESVLPVIKKEGKGEANMSIGLGWNMDMQTLLCFAHIQTEGAAYSILY